MDRTFVSLLLLLLLSATTMTKTMTIAAPESRTEAEAGTVDARIEAAYQVADEAFARVVANNCYEMYDPEKCHDLADLSPKDVRLYFGGALDGLESVVAVLPDNDAQLTGRAHDAYFVLDPFPAYKFGHPVFMFFVDIGVAAWKCDNNEGIYTVLSDNRTTCSQMVRSRYCNERPLSSSWDCQMKFLPIVVPAISDRLQADNLLRCLDSKDTFLRNCPLIRDDGAEFSDECNHLKTNGRGCSTTSFNCNSHKPVNQAVMLFGGWSRNIADFVTYFDLVSMRNKLMSWGFAENNIRTFFANGINTYARNDDDSYAYAPNIIRNVEAADKLNVRKYIKGICSAEKCAETFFLYMSSPSRKDGNSLLWDANGDGLVDNDEVYLMKEFVSDIAHCLARRVVVFVDQSFSGQLTQYAQVNRRRMANVMIIPTTSDEDWTPRHSFNTYMRESSKRICLYEYIVPFQESQVMPPVYTGPGMEDEMRNVTISGIRPCATR